MCPSRRIRSAAPGRGRSENAGPRAGFSARLAALFLVLSVLATGLGGCAAKDERSWADLSQRGAGSAFQPVTFDVAPFTLAGLLKGHPGQSPDLVVYLEGDGRGVVRGRVTEDPTPSRAMGFELARSDPAPAVLYLARVGQFQPSQTGPDYQAYWSNKRLSEEVVNAADRAVDQAKARIGARCLHLVGYSGGGGLALLLAERRSDVLTVTTVAGLLDTTWWVREKNYQPLTGSLNPADQARTLVNTPQVHFYGTDDVIIPAAMSAHFQSLAPFTRFKRVEVETNHWKAWPELWPELLDQYLLPWRARALADQGEAVTSI